MADTVELDYAQLAPRSVGDIAGNFVVPDYQRGFRWGEDEVRRLLDDIWTNAGGTYYLQPVVVKRNGADFELIDGQQRLTTLFLIFAYLQRESLQSAGANYTVAYATRPELAGYLANPDSWSGQSTMNIDTFHIHQATETIRAWFGQPGHQEQAANAIYRALLDDVQVIWYEAPANVDGAALFRRLNIGRIGLTDAELVKALLLSRADRPADDGNREEPARAIEIAAQWDGIERDLCNPESWAFITGGSREFTSHIELLLDTLVGGPTGRDRPLYSTFEALHLKMEQTHEGLLAFWNEVIDLHAMIMGWYADPALFHKVGFLTADGVAFEALVEAAQGKRKSEFTAELDAMIRRRLNLTESGLRDLTYGSHEKAQRALLLWNVEAARAGGHSWQRFSFGEYASANWSLEHIHAQNAQDLTRAEDWATWLRDHRRALADLGRADESAQEVLERTDRAISRHGDGLKRPDQDGIGRPLFRELQGELLRLLAEDGNSDDADVDSIANLALLNSGTNSALGNSVFAVKRDYLLDVDRAGGFIPVCTRNAFLKYYTPSRDQQVAFWSTSDRRHYIDEFVARLGPYLQADGTAE